MEEEEEEGEEAHSGWDLTCAKFRPHHMWDHVCGYGGGGDNIFC
jgi:hypothetical protein